jgi:hypothetical protein
MKLKEYIENLQKLVDERDDWKSKFYNLKKKKNGRNRR